MHDGGFRVEREFDGELRFTRVDGRVIPRFGYRAQDCTDDDVGDEEAGNPSREGFLGSVFSARGESPPPPERQPERNRPADGAGTALVLE